MSPGNSFRSWITALYSPNDLIFPPGFWRLQWTCYWIVWVSLSVILQSNQGWDRISEGLKGNQLHALLHRWALAEKKEELTVPSGTTENSQHFMKNYKMFQGSCCPTSRQCILSLTRLSQLSKTGTAWAIRISPERQNWENGSGWMQKLQLGWWTWRHYI